MKISFRDVLLVLKRGTRKRCPQCGIGRVSDGWYQPRSECTSCQLVFEPDDGGTWAFMYMSTALIIGVFFLGMFLVRPVNTALWRCLVMAAAVPAIFGTLPYRKGVAIAIEYLIDLAVKGERSIELRRDEACNDRASGFRDD